MRAAALPGGAPLLSQELSAWHWPDESDGRRRRPCPAKHADAAADGSAARESERRIGRRANAASMEYFLQQLINGVTLGSIYGLIAIGYTMVYGIIGMINFAHGDVFMVGAFIALIAFLALVAIGITAVPLALFLVLLIAMALTALYGWTVERFAYRPLRHPSAWRR